LLNNSIRVIIYYIKAIFAIKKEMMLMKIASNNDYKGTAFGDPARLATQDIKRVTKQTAQDTTKLDKLSTAASSAKSYPVEYKGTAFGDPAKFYSPDYTANSLKQVAEVKGSKFDITT
jgi:hypothetical protein